MSRLKIVKKALGSTPVVGYFYRGAVRTYYYLNWLRLCWIGRRYLTRSSGQKFDPSNPLKIDGLHITELHPTPRDNRFQYNPTIRLEENGLRIYWRISNWGDNPEVNAFGLPNIRSGEQNVRLITQTGVGNLRVVDGHIFDTIQDEGIVDELDPLNVDAEENYALAEDGYIPRVTYEDPKAFPNDPTLLTLTAVEQGQQGSSIVTRATVALFDLKTKSIVLLKHPAQKLREKNWVLASSNDQTITLLWQSEPHVIVVIDRNTGELVSERRQPLSGEAFLHGGSSFVLVDDSYYLRVARHRISLRGLLNIHVSHIVKHDLEFNEIFRSRPFVFRKYAFEICNGLEYDGNHFYLAWGENDKKVFVGSIAKDVFLQWLDENKSERS